MEEDEQASAAKLQANFFGLTTRASLCSGRFVPSSVISVLAEGLLSEPTVIHCKENAHLSHVFACSWQCWNCALAVWPTSISSQVKHLKRSRFYHRRCLLSIKYVHNLKYFQTLASTMHKHPYSVLTTLLNRIQALSNPKMKKKIKLFQAGFIMHARKVS